jgi:tetratricopeptide (TPR) repeat protein
MYIGGLTIWTSTMYGQQSAYAVYAGDSTPESGSKSFGYTALCVRPMEPDILQLAKDAQVKSPVPDVQTLKAYGMIVHAHDAFAIAQYQKSITQANAALALKPKFAPAYWAMGVSYGMLGQWDQAVTNLQTAVKIDKYYNNPKAALKWALQGQKAARTGGSPKDKPPVWE